jgi:hypothetical protein
MLDTVFHQLETQNGQFEYVAVSRETVRIGIGGQVVEFNLQTAEQLIDILGGYCEDSRRARRDYYSEIDRMRDSIETKSRTAEYSESLPGDIAEALGKLKIRENGNGI